MTNFDTVREALAAIADTHVHTYKQALTALAEIERQHYTPEDMADAQAKAFRAGVESVTTWHLSKDGLPPIGAEVIGGYFYKDTWLKGDPEVFAWGQCRVLAESHRDFPDGKRWATFGPSHNQITHWCYPPHTPGTAPVAQQSQKITAEDSLRFRLDCTKEQLEAAEQECSELRAKLKAQQPQAEPHKPLFADMIAQHPGLREELKAMDDPTHPLFVQQPQAEAVPPGFKLLKDTTHDERSWPEDYSDENGCYCNTCVNCLREFTGYKRRGICKVCDAAMAQGAKT